MNSSKSFTEVIAWQRAHQFVLKTYILTKGFPREEVYGLTSQLRRAAVSIAANIAEGYARRSKMEKMRFFNFAQASLEECKYYAILATDLKYMSDTTYRDLFEEVSKLLNSYKRAIAASLK